MSKENDLAKYKGENEMIDVTLFNIRRERRCEFIGEGMRMDDLIRWRSLDRLLVERFIPEGFNFWGSDAYKRYEGEDAKFEYIEYSTTLWQMFHPENYPTIYVLILLYKRIMKSMTVILGLKRIISIPYLSDRSNYYHRQAK